MSSDVNKGLGVGDGGDGEGSGRAPRVAGEVKLSQGFEDGSSPGLGHVYQQRARALESGDEERETRRDALSHSRSSKTTNRMDKIRLTFGSD